jgi:hypothetical protein
MTVSDGSKVLHNEYFVLENSSDEGGIDGDTKNFKCGAYEKTFFNGKILSGYLDRQKTLYDPTNTIDDDGLDYGIINHILKHKAYGAFRVTHIDQGLLGIERVFTFSDSTVTNVFHILEELFKAFIVIDNFTGEIKIYEAAIGTVSKGYSRIILNYWRRTREIQQL